MKMLPESETYLDGRGNGLIHPIIAMDVSLACSAEKIHVVTNWEQIEKRLSEVINRKYVLVTGGLGYIGSHTIIELVKADKFVLIIDNMSNAKSHSLDRVKFITQKPDHFAFQQVDIRNKTEFEEKIFKKYNLEGVIHFAAMKAVGESVSKPLEYYDNNVGATIKML